MWADQTLSLTSILVTLVVCHLDLELNVVANVGVLPHEELDTDRQLSRSDLLVQLTFRVLDDHSRRDVLLTKLHRRVGSLHSVLNWICVKQLMDFLRILCGTRVTTNTLFDNI